MANTYIHSLPDALTTLDPESYTILDYKNIFNEYITAKLPLSSLSNFFIQNYISSEEHLGTKKATSWVNVNSSDMNLTSLIINPSGSIFETPILTIEDSRNLNSTLLFKNNNENTKSLIEINFQNSLTGSNFRIGTLGINYNDLSFNINDGKNNNYILSENKNLLIGTAGSNQDICFFTGSPINNNERIYIKGDGSGNVGIKNKTPNVSLTINGNVSTNRLLFDETNNSSQWNSSYSYVILNSSKNSDASTLLQNISSNIVLKTGATLLGSLYTTQTLTGAFATDELISRRYVDSVFVQTTISGNFIPALYYIKTEVDDKLNNPNSVYNFVNTNSSLELDSRTFVNTNSSVFLNLNSTINQTSGNWQSVYSYVNQTSAQEEDQTEVTNFVISNSSRSLEVQTYVNNISSNITDLYSTSVANSSLNIQARTYVITNSASINSNINLVNSNFESWNSVYTTVQISSAQNNEVNTITSSNSAKWNESYTIYSGNSGTYTTTQYVNTSFLPLTGGNVVGRLFAASLGIGNTVTVTGNLGTLSRRVEIFDINGNSLGFIPVYGSIT